MAAVKALKEEKLGRISINIERKTGKDSEFELFHPQRPKNSKVRLPMTYSTKTFL